MNRNDYRRAFIMLRAAIQGYGGHVRLERRTLTGSMYFFVTAPQGVSELSAALAGQQNGACYAVPIGPLTRDRRGQLTLAWQFDPRSIDGRPLEAYSWVVVAAVGGPCAVALTGNVEGARGMDLPALSRAVCNLFAPAETPAADLPEAGAPTGTVPEDSAWVAEQTHYEPARAESGESSAGIAEGGEMQGDVRIYTSTRARLRSAARRRAARSGGSADSAPMQTAEGATADAGPTTAGRQLSLDITTPWPEAVEPLRRVFATQAPLDTPLGDGYTYVSCPMPNASGYDPCIVGLKAENGRITAVRYAVPGRRAPQPPAGLERYRWLPAVGENGYWVMDADM